MAGKYALYLPFHIIAALENENFSDAEIGAFVRGVIKYHLDGTPPRFDDRSLNLLFSSCKQEFDYNISRYEAKVESCRKNGKKGGAPTGNRNAAKPEKQPKQAESVVVSDIDIEIEIESENSGSTAAAGGGEGVLKNTLKQLPLLLIFLFLNVNGMGILSLKRREGKSWTPALILPGSPGSLLSRNT
jgi:hypothetical protein